MNRIKVFCIAALALTIAGCATIAYSDELSEQRQVVSQPVIISSIEHSEGDGITELVVKASVPFEYTTYDPDPGVLVIEIPEGNIDSLPDSLDLETAQVKNIRVKKIAGTQGDFFIGRLEISCHPESRHTVTMEGSDLHIKVEGAGSSRAKVVEPEADEVKEEAKTDLVAERERSSETAEETKEAGTPQATRVSKIRIDDENDAFTEVIIEGDGKFSYNNFEMEEPDRVVIDLKDVSMLLPSKKYDVQGRYIEQVRVSQFKTVPEKVARIVFDLKETSPYEISQSGDSLHVKFWTVPESRMIAGLKQDIISPPVLEAKEVASEKDKAPVPASPAEQVPVVEPNPFQPRPVTASGSPVASREEAPAPPAEQEEKTESAPPVAAARIPEKAGDQKVKEDYVIFREEPETLAAPAGEEKKMTLQFQTVVVNPEEVKYTGKKISLNLVDADIKQIFRLFHEISGLNFVLDPAVGGKVTIVLDNVPWDQALDIILKNNGLDKIFEDNVIRIAPTQRLAQESASRKQLKDAKELEADPVTITKTLSYAKAQEIEKIIRQSGMISPKGRVIMDERTNSLIVTDVPTRIPPIDNLVSSLDTETPQVMIEARIVETSRQFVQDFGVNWGFTGVADSSRGTQTNLQFPHNATVDYQLNLPFTKQGAMSPNQFGVTFGNVLNSFTLDLAIEALEVEGKARVLSAPKIATQNNEKAEIERGVRIPVVNTTATEINVEFVSASLRLMVTPQITAEGTIVLDIQVENNTPDFVNRVGDVPPINTQRAQTTVLITDGGTTVIGGIFSQSEGLSEAGVPWFRKVPLFGWLFKRRNVTNENRELLIFLTAKIMRSSS